MSEGTAARAARYWHDAQEFRQMARTETDEVFRETLTTIAREYEDLARDLAAGTREPLLTVRR